MNELKDAVIEAARALYEQIEKNDFTDSLRHRATMLKAFRDLGAALSDITERGDGWRPIESAPRGGQWFLWCAADGTARFTQAVIRWPEYKECFNEGWWQPLPPAPGESQ